MASIYSEEYQIVISALKKARKAKGITQSQLSSALGRPQSFIAKVENGERRLDIVEFIHLARLLALDPYPVLAKVGARIAPLESQL